MTRRKSRKIFGVILILLSLIVAMIPTGESVAEDDSKSKLSDFQLSGTTLIRYTGTAETVSVPDSVKVIADEAFANNSYMVNLNLPKDLEKISYAAFSGCNSLKKVVIPNKVTEIGSAAFCNCTSLSDVTIGTSVYRLGSGVFTGCPNLSTVTVSGSDYVPPKDASGNVIETPNTISGTDIPIYNDYFVCVDGAIYDKSKETLYEVLQGAKKKRSENSKDLVTVTTYDMPSTVTNIMPYALYGCKNIESINLSPNLTEIPAFAFSYCNGLTSIKIPYSVTSIDVKAFEYCINLENVEIPVSVEFIHDTAFHGCSKLKINAPEGSYASEWFKNFDNSMVNIIDTEDNSGLTDASGNKIIDINSQNRKPIEGLIGETIIAGRHAYFIIDNSKMTVKGTDKAEREKAEELEAVLQTETNGKGLSLPKFAVVDDHIASKAFYGDTNLKEYTIDDNITSIGDFAFARSALTNIEIPNGVTHIGMGAFYHCDDLATIMVPSSVEEIEAYAFAKTRMMDNWKLYGSSEFLILGDGILVAYNGTNTSVTVPEGVKQIGPECFKDISRLMEISLPDSLEIIREGAFYNCKNLRSVTGGSNVKTIEDRAFWGCPLNTIRITDSVKEVGLDAYDLDGTSLKDEYKSVVFMGNELPKVSYTDTTSRLSNSEYRSDVFSGVKVAIVNSADVNRVDTVLDRNKSGFSGLICVISEPNNEYFNGTLKIIDCTLTKEEAENFSVPSTMYVFGKGYNFLEDELDSVLSMARNGAYFETISEEDVPKVSFTGNKDTYTLNIVKNDTPNSKLVDAYKRIYADNVPANFTTFDVSLKEDSSNVLVSKLGLQSAKVSIELPSNVPTSNLHVISMDEDGQLEDFPYEVVSDGSKLKVSFEITHTGSYGLYSFNSTSVSKYALDASPDTGELMHPKWFLMIGLLALGTMMLLIKGKEERVTV